jgi:beta-barrel assembly-enhancing protease
MGLVLRHHRRCWISVIGLVATATSLLGALVMPSYPAAAQTPPAKTPDSAPQKPADKKPPKPPAEDSEIKMGREAHEELMRSGLKLVRDPALVQRVETIGKKIAEVANQTPVEAGYGSSKLVPYEYKFFIVDDPDINAFSIPGGYIYINKGLLNYCQSDDELAGVLGHEIMHAAHHHVAKLSREQRKFSDGLLIAALATLVARVPTTDAMNVLQGFQLVAVQKINGFGQAAEKDADHAGLIVSSKAGYNPVGMLTFMERLERSQRMRPEVELGIFRTHPPEKERVDAITAQIKGMGVTINRRAVTNMLKVEVRQVMVGASGIPASEVLLDRNVIYRTPSADRAKEVADRLNKALDQTPQIYDVTRKGTTVLLRGETIFSVGAQDTDLPGSPTAETLADTGYKNLRLALYKQSIENGY